MKKLSKQQHPFHMVDHSPWPLLTAFAAFSLVFGLVFYMHKYEGGFFALMLSLGSLLLCMALWWRDVIREATFNGDHTVKVQKHLALGMLLFITSEVMFFVAFFWAFFHMSLAPSIEVGGVWPPKGIEVLNAWEVPLLNTIILLSSGATTTWAHAAILANKKQQGIIALIITVVLAAIFTAFQGYEYIHASFTIADGIYGSTFYMATGFHGFHVIIGTIFLSVCLVRLLKDHFTEDHHFGFEAAAWYWHFVDVVWLFLFVSIYYWGGA
uniref:Cytochrome c oxidase subunit 3 n=1 Tax=Palpitomonas bilix TaxID=652834 RepID=A0A1E1GHR5_9EUKA|nr:cytochrome c oxidase subunit 3 [Palpitomonas bilix]BAV82407.1 cytochrome c oxidase subunit 3 [Palpitomonas bilix]